MQQFTGKQYLAIDIASSYGMDKNTWDERLDWFNTHEAKLEEMLNQAEHPALFFAGVQAWRKMQAGVPTGYMISLDATSSGLQLLAALTGDRKAAELCNVINVKDPHTGKALRLDAYSAIYKALLTLVGSTAKVTRDMAKDAVMTALYGSKAVPKRVFGEGNLLAAFFETMSTVAPAAWELNEAMVTMWNANTTCHSWVLPDNFHVHVKVMATVRETVHFLEQPYEVTHQVNQPTDTGRSLGANTIHSLDGMIVREMTRRCDYDPKKVGLLKDLCYGILYEGATIVGHHPCDDADSKMVSILWKHYEQTGYLSARIIDHLHMHNMCLVTTQVISNLLWSLPLKPFKVISIHDCFRCHPNYGNDLRIQYVKQLQLIANSTILASMISQLIGKPVNIGKLDPHMWKEIADAEYALS